MGSVRGASSLSQVYSQLACRVGRSRPCTAPLTQGQKVEEGMLPSADIERSKFGANSSRIRTYHILQENGKLGMPLFVMFHNIPQLFGHYSAWTNSGAVGRWHKGDFFLSVQRIGRVD